MNDIEILERHNKWRRGDEDVSVTNPRELGEAIESVIAKAKSIGELEYRINNLKNNIMILALIDKSSKGDRELAIRLTASEKENKKLRVEIEELKNKNEWQPIETIPIDCTNVLLFISKDGVHNGYCDGKNYYVENNGDYIDGGYGNDYRCEEKPSDLGYGMPTKWQPLPTSPKENKND